MKDQSVTQKMAYLGRKAKAWLDPGRWFGSATDCALCSRLGSLWSRLRYWWDKRRQGPQAPVDFTLPENNQIRPFVERDYPGSRNRCYMVHLPPDYDGRKPLPLVMVLHGCKQTHLDIRQISNFDALADHEGFVVVYPFITSYSGLRNRNCWGWWFKREITPGQGEVEDLWQMIEEVQRDYRIDQSRIHVTGLSSGGGMAVAMLVAHGEKLASGAVVAGVPYAETARAVGFVAWNKGHFRPVAEIAAAMRKVIGETGRCVPLFIAHSHNDATVNIQAAKNIRDSWASCFKLDMRQPAAAGTGITGGTAWQHIRYRGADARSRLETLFLSGPGHGWYGGSPGDYSYPDAPDLSAMIWQFFASHPHENRDHSETEIETAEPARPRLRRSA